MPSALAFSLRTSQSEPAPEMPIRTFPGALPSEVLSQAASRVAARTEAAAVAATRRGTEESVANRSRAGGAVE
ncbi:hypothetical protein UK12_07000 [Saccharothrix sp. ST-888]|nr:hypothetical protein UK12_07000 [Saccharothrix sp. ST-888]